MSIKHRLIWTLSLLIGVALVLFVVLNAPSVAQEHLLTDVVRVVDGDTVVVRLKDGCEETVRLIGIDTPETVHPNRPVEPWGSEASVFTKVLLPPGRSVILELDVQERDRYGRLLAYVYLPNGPMINVLLLAAGLAKIASFPPNVTYMELFRDIQAAAREAGIGIWSQRLFEPSPTGETESTSNVL